ncbi:hypothetical protein, partial [Ralstonia solanacearum]
KQGRAMFCFGERFLISIIRFRTRIDFFGMPTPQEFAVGPKENQYGSQSAAPRVGAKSASKRAEPRLAGCWAVGVAAAVRSQQASLGGAQRGVRLLIPRNKNA